MAKRKKDKRALFDPDKIATAISQHLNRDLNSASQMYGGINRLQAFFLEGQRVSTLKKYDPVVGDPDRLEEEAFAKFREINEHIGRINEAFRPPRSIPARDLTPLELTLKRAQWLIRWVLRDITWSELAQETTHSGGSTLGVPFRDTSQDAKFTYPMTATPAVAQLFQNLRREDKRLSSAIDDVNSNQLIAEEYEIVEASRATTVPKTASKRRMIAVEPTLNMFFQQGLMTVMYKRLKDVGLDVESLPQKHERLAYEGSVSGTKATIDFSSASDCVSVELLRYLLTPKWFAWVSALRCPSMTIGGETISLNMISTMGNAGTFPLETLVFWCLGVAAVMYRTRSNPNSLLSTAQERDMVSVFGDDCILPTADAPFFMEVCTSVGFLVNEEKSFFDPGPGFRESCGGDYFHGSYVRPLFIKAPTSVRVSALEPWLYVILNATLKKYIEYFGDVKYLYDKALLEYLFGLFREYKLLIKLVPPDFPDDAGLKTSDWRRLRECYGLRFSSIAQTEQGWCRFSYCHFRYREQRKLNEHLRYALWLKNPTGLRAWWETPVGVRTRNPIRKKGSYVVARSTAPGWGL